MILGVFQLQVEFFRSVQNGRHPVNDWICDILEQETEIKNHFRNRFLIKLEFNQIVKIPKIHSPSIICFCLFKWDYFMTAQFWFGEACIY